MFNISQAAKETGLSSKTIRYYESLGLISSPSRSENGYRVFNQKVLDELSFIQRAKQAGFNLEESKQLLDLQRSDERISGEGHCCNTKTLWSFDTVRRLGSYWASRAE